jgi:integrase
MNETGISLFKKYGVWYIQYTDAIGKRRQKSTSCKYKPDAIKVLSDFSKFLVEGNKNKPTSLSSFTKDFLKFAESNKCHGTADIYGRALRCFIRIVGDMDINSITPKQWDDFKTFRMNERKQLRKNFDTPEDAAAAREQLPFVSATSVNVALRHIKAAMSTAARWQLIVKNPFERLPLVTIPKRTPAFLTIQDAERLLSGITEPWLKDFIIFAINTGMRRGEILSLRWSDIDTVTRVARITNRQDFTTKNGEERAVSLNDAALMVIKRLKVSKHHEYIFSCEHGRRLNPDRVTTAFKAAIRAAGLPEGLHLHSTRHSFASLLVGGGTSLFTVSKLLGHSNSKTSEIYSHLLPSHMQHEVDKINIGITPTVN